MQDLELFFNFELQALYPDNYDNVDLVQKLVEMTKGLFLVAFFVIEYLKRENVASPERVLELFPNGISSVYENYFSRLKEVLLPYISEEDRFFKMLEAVVATNNPLPKDMLYDILCVKSEREVPRQERKSRKDALNSLHCLFPVEGGHVTPFHKSVVDWLNEEEEEHDFSVRVEDGIAVLLSQCNHVLSDIMNGRKDLDKPLSVTDNEKYALSFLNYLVYPYKGSVLKDNKYGFFSNIFLLSALKIVQNNFGNVIGDGIISRSLLQIISNLTMCFPIITTRHDPCRLHIRPISFGGYLAFVLQAAHSEGLSEGTTPNPLAALNKHGFSYFHEKSLLRTPLVLTKGPQGNVELLPYLQYLFKCKDGFIAVSPMSWSNSLSTAVYKLQYDEHVIASEPLSGRTLVTTSLNINFIVAAERNGKKIEVLDITTLEVVSQYESPIDAMRTCHVFGDDQCWFIIIQGWHDNKIYVVKGLTGQVHNTITVTEGSTVMDVSCQGHIVVARTWKRKEPETRNSFTNKDDEVERMNWKIHHAEFPPASNSPSQKPSKQYYIYTYRELCLYHYECVQEPIPIYPLVEKICQCSGKFLSDTNVDDAVHFSDDGRLFAYHYKASIFIVNTSDGSLFKCWSFDVISVSWPDILFVSRSYLMVIDQSYMYVINVKTDEIEHRFSLPYPAFPNMRQYLVFPEEGEKSFSLVNTHFDAGSYEVSRLVFHNFNLQGLQ